MSATAGDGSRGEAPAVANVDGHPTLLSGELRITCSWAGGVYDPPGEEPVTVKAGERLPAGCTVTDAVPEPDGEHAKLVLDAGRDLAGFTPRHGEDLQIHLHTDAAVDLEVRGCKGAVRGPGRWCIGAEFTGAGNGDLTVAGEVSAWATRGGSGDGNVNARDCDRADVRRTGDGAGNADIEGRGTVARSGKGPGAARAATPEGRAFHYGEGPGHAENVLEDGTKVHTRGTDGPPRNPETIHRQEPRVATAELGNLAAERRRRAEGGMPEMPETDAEIGKRLETGLQERTTKGLEEAKKDLLRVATLEGGEKARTADAGVAAVDRELQVRAEERGLTEVPRSETPERPAGRAGTPGDRERGPEPAR